MIKVKGNVAARQNLPLVVGNSLPGHRLSKLARDPSTPRTDSKGESVRHAQDDRLDRVEYTSRNVP
jgi:hypothetical protein